jgi:hypothetical protein
MGGDEIEAGVIGKAQVQEMVSEWSHQGEEWKEKSRKFRAESRKRLDMMGGFKSKYTKFTEQKVKSAQS